MSRYIIYRCISLPLIDPYQDYSFLVVAPSIHQTISMDSSSIQWLTLHSSPIGKYHCFHSIDHSSRLAGFVKKGCLRSVGDCVARIKLILKLMVYNIWLIYWRSFLKRVFVYWKYIQTNQLIII